MTAKQSSSCRHDRLFTAFDTFGCHKGVLNSDLHNILKLLRFQALWIVFYYHFFKS